MSENPCRDIGCPASCCRNIVGSVFGKVDNFLKAFPGATSVDSEAALRNKVKDREHGVYYFIDGEEINFSVSGACPNLRPDYSCGIHGKRFYPQACINMIVGHKPCRDSQLNHMVQLANPINLKIG